MRALEKARGRHADDEPEEFRTHFFAVASTAILGGAFCYAISAIVLVPMLQASQHLRLPVPKLAPDLEANATAARLVIAVHPAWKYEVAGEQIEGFDPAIAAIAQKLSAAPDLRLVVRADKTVRFDEIKRLLRAIQTIDARGVTFSVVEPAAE